MKRLFLFIYFIGAFGTAFSQKANLNEIRNDFQKLANDSLSCSELDKKLSQFPAGDIMAMCYKGAVSASIANFIKDKKQKLSKFNSGKKMIDQAVAADSNNIELRFIRFVIQEESPKILGYNKQINSDKNFILKNYASIKDASIKKMMTPFLRETYYLTEAEKTKLGL
jgi:hypothetical protein